MTKTRTMAIVACVVMLFVSGCSLNEVTAWMRFNGHEVTRAEARKLADLVNKNAKAGCDPNYEALKGCVPDNKTEMHCKGDGGRGFAIEGPLIILNWDHYELDKDGDGVGCEAFDPIGEIEYARQGSNAASITVKGWAMDADGDQAIKVRITDNGKARTYTASQKRSDLAWIGFGTNHGFSVNWPASPGSHRICATALNREGGKDTSLGCGDVDVDWRTMLVDAINSERSVVGAPALEQCDELDASADGHARWMAATGNLETTGANGSTPNDRATAAGYPDTIGETIAVGYETVAELVDDYMADADYRSHLLDPLYRSIGISRRNGEYLGFDNILYWVQDYGDVAC